MKFAVADVDELRDTLPEANAASSVPAFRLYKAGQLVASCEGADEKTLLALLKQHGCECAHM